jgi:hypothetical protein
MGAKPGHQGGQLGAGEGETERARQRQRQRQRERQGWGASLTLSPLQEKADLGELNFSLCYLPTAGRLTVTIIKASNLKAMDLTGFSGESWDTPV